MDGAIILSIRSNLLILFERSNNFEKKKSIFTTAVHVRQDTNSQILQSWSELGLQVADQDGETVTMLHLFVVLEFTVAEGLLDAVPDRSKCATFLLNFGGWELPSQVDPIEIVVVEEPIHRVDEFRSRLRRLGLNKSNILLLFLIKFESLTKLNGKRKCPSPQWRGMYS